MAARETFVVYEGKRERHPALAARVVSKDGTAFHVIRADRLPLSHGLYGVSFEDAVREAFRCAGRDLPS